MASRAEWLPENHLVTDAQSETGNHQGFRAGRISSWRQLQDLVYGMTARAVDRWASVDRQDQACEGLLAEA